MFVRLLSFVRQLFPLMSISFMAVLAYAFIFSVSMGLSFPLIGLFLKSQGMSSTYIGLNTASVAIATLFLAPFYPRWIAYLGLRQFLLLMMAIFAFIFFLFGFFHSMTVWMVLRALMGIGVTGLFIAGELWAQRLTNDTNRGRVLGLYMVIISIGFAFGTSIVSVTGFEGVTPFVLASLVTLLLSIPVFFFAPKASEEPASNGQSFLKNFWRLFSVAPLIFFSIILFTLLDQSFGVLLPIFGLQHELPLFITTLLMTFFALGGVVGQPVTGYLIDKGSTYLLLLMYYGIVCFWGASLLFIRFYSVPLIFCLMAVGGFLFIGAYTITISIMGQRFKGYDLTIMYVICGILWNVGGLIGPIVSGIAMDISIYGLPFVVIIFSFFVFVALLIAGSQWTHAYPADKDKKGDSSSSKG